MAITLTPAEHLTIAAEHLAELDQHAHDSLSLGLAAIGHCMLAMAASEQADRAEYERKAGERLTYEQLYPEEPVRSQRPVRYSDKPLG